MEEKDFEALVDMFATEGWKYYIAGAKELERAITNGAADSADTNDKWQYCRGQTHQLRALVGYEAFVRATWKQIEDNEALELFNTENEVDVDSV